jgi:hypothetical protein
MANPQRGEFDLTLGGTSYRFRLGAEALIAFQEQFRVNGDAPSVRELLRQYQRESLVHIRALLWAGLREHHPDITLTGVADLIDAAAPSEIQAVLGGMADSTQPDPADVAALGLDGNGRPPAAQAEGTGRQARKRKARASTGAPSISPPVAPV